MTDWVRAVERAYVAAATGGERATLPDPLRLRAAIGAVASRYLAVGTPRTLGLVADAATLDDAIASIDAHRTWFQPRELRCAGAAVPGAAAVTLAEALACDIACVHVPIALAPGPLRRGTHINLLAPGAAIDDELRRIAAIYDEHPHLGQLAAGLIDGRQLDELTIFVATTCSPWPDPRSAPSSP